MVLREPLNIVILGGSYAGLSVAHQFLRKTIHDLRRTPTAPRYRLILVSPSTCLYWNVGAPRAICNNEHDSSENYFIPFLDAFAVYDQDLFHFIQGEATAVDFSQRNVTIEPIIPGSPSISPSTTPLNIIYHALVIATGSRSDCPLLSLNGSHERTLSAINKFRSDLPTATNCVIVGGGSTGVECAGQIATWLKNNRSPSLKGRLRHAQYHSKHSSNDLSTRDDITPEPNLSQEPMRVTLISGGPRLLGNMHRASSEKAERMLNNLGVRIIHEVRLLSAQQLPNRVTRCILSHDLEISCDLFIAATGTKPNTEYISRYFLDANGYVVIDRQSLRVATAGERVFAIGSCVATNRKTLIDVFNSVPVLLHNLKNDLIAWEIKNQYSYRGCKDSIQAMRDIRLGRQFKTTQLCPISKRGGVGMIKGRKIPSLMVWLLKGRDYNLRAAHMIATSGESPFTICG